MQKSLSAVSMFTEKRSLDMKNILRMLQRHKTRVAIAAAVLLLSAAALIVFLCLPRPEDAVNQVSVYVSAGQKETTVSAGQKIVLTVMAASVDDMYGYQFQVNYDENEFEYTGELKSELDAISTIFAKPFDGYQLIGATMIGDQTGVSGENVVICEMEFTTLKDCVLTDSALGISNINVVSPALEYDEDVSGWSCSTEVLTD